MHFSVISEKIAEGINTNANDGAIEALVGKRVQAEITRRADILEKAYDKYNSTVKELKNARPDMVSYVTVKDSEEAVKHEAYSDKQMKNIANLRKLVSEFELAFMKAFGTEPDKINEGYQKLQALSNQGGNKKQDEAE